MLYAEHYGRATLDEDFFSRTLRQVLATDPATFTENRLLNEIAHDRASLLLSIREDLF